MQRLVAVLRGAAGAVVMFELGGARVACGGHGICVRAWGRGRGVNTPQDSVGVPVSGKVNTALVHDEDIRTKEYDSAAAVC